MRENSKVPFKVACSLPQKRKQRAKMKMMDDDYDKMVRIMKGEKLGNYRTGPVIAQLPIEPMDVELPMSKRTSIWLVVACCMSVGILLGASHEMVRNATLRNIAAITGFDELFSSSEDERKLYLRKQIGYDDSEEETGRESIHAGNEILDMFLNIQQESFNDKAKRRGD